MNLLKSIRKWWRSLTRKERRLMTTAACLAAGIAAVAIFAIICRSDEPPLPGEPPPAAAAVLLDVSDPVTGRNAEAMIDEIARIGDEELPPYGKLTVYDMHDLYDMHDQSEEVLSLTRPRRKSDCCALAERCGHLEAIYMEVFEGVLRTQIKNFLSAQKSKSISPIIEALGEFSQLSDYRSVPEGSKNLYVVSDMLQNTPACGFHYKQPVGTNGFANPQNPPCYQWDNADFSGWDVTVLYILRRKCRHLQNNNHKRFWMDYFEDRNAHSVKIADVNYFGSGAQCPSRP